MAAKRKIKRRLKHGTRDFAKKDVTLPRWDYGAQGPANKQRESQVEDAMDPEIDPETGKARNTNPNGVTRLRFFDMLQVYHRRQVITDRGYKAGCILRDAWERTEQGIGNDWSKERVDSTPKPDAAIAIQIDRVSKLVNVTRRIPHHDHRLLIAVVAEKRAIGDLQEYRGRNHDAGKRHLRDALDRLADALGA